MRYNRLNPSHWILALFSNSRKTDYLAGKPDYHRDKVIATRRIFYWFRNPGHDFAAYIIGFAEDVRFTTVRGDAKNTLKPGWIFAIRAVSWLRLPYVAYQGRGWQFYLGWRPFGGFGIKLRRIA